METASDWQRLLLRLEQLYATAGHSAGSEPQAGTGPFRATALQLFRECQVAPPGGDAAMALRADWTRCLELRDGRTREVLERLASLPPNERFCAAAGASLEAAGELILALLDLAEALRPHHDPTASSLAQSALALSPQLQAGEDRREVFDEQASYWISAAQEGLLRDRLLCVRPRLDVAQALVQAGCGDTELKAQLAVARAQLYWRETRIEACLIELEAALSFCEAVDNPGLRGSALYLKGRALARIGRLAAARSCLEESLELLPGTREEWVEALARDTLERLDWRI